MDLDAVYRVAGYDGIAFHLWGHQTAVDSSGIEIETGMVIVTMVGDDRRIAVDRDDLTVLDDSEYCGGCGQIGCHAYDGPDEDEPSMNDLEKADGLIQYGLNNP